MAIFEQEAPHINLDEKRNKNKEIKRENFNFIK